DPGLWRSVAAPHAISPLVAGDPTVFLFAQVTENRWAGYHGSDFGFGDPAAAGAFTAWSDQIDTFRVVSGWLHAYDGYGDTTERVLSVAPDGTTHVREAPATGPWRGSDAWGRWVVLGAEIDLQRGVQRSRILDVTGAIADRDVEIYQGVAPAIAFLGRGA